MADSYYQTLEMWRNNFNHKWYKIKNSDSSEAQELSALDNSQPYNHDSCRSRPQPSKKSSKITMVCIEKTPDGFNKSFTFSK